MDSRGDGYFSGASKLAGDTRVALLLLREARDRACSRVFGVSSDESALVTLIALATLAHAAHGKLHHAWTAHGGPTRNDTLIGVGVLNEVVHWLAGDWSREVPVIPASIMAAVIAHQLSPWARHSLHDVRILSHRIRIGFEHRYGHLIRPNRRRPVTTV
jgi:hypothetical protein